MSELGESLLALVDDEGRPIDEMLVDLLQGCLVVLVQFHLLPQLVGLVCALCRLHVEVTHPLLLTHRGVLRVRQRARTPIAQPRQVILVPAEVLGLGLHAV